MTTPIESPTRSEARPITVHGIVIPCGWAEDGAVTAVAIDTYDELSFRVADHGAGRALKGFVRKRVEAWGRLSPPPEPPVLTLAGYRLLPDL